MEVCNLCAKKFKDTQTLFKHNENAHNCKFCSLTFKKQNGTYDYTPKKCDECTNIFSNSAELMDHKRSEHVVSSDICEEKFT